MKKILVVDDERSTLYLLRSVLSSQNWDVSTATTPERAAELTAETKFDLILTDINLQSEQTGMDLLRQMRDDAPVILITSAGTLETAVEAATEGALDIVAKPFNVEDLVALVRRVLTEKENEKTSETVVDDAIQPSKSGLLGRSPAMLDLFKKIARVASSDGTVLITGESGTGKELVARALHRFSQRASHPFVPVNCGALTETLLESELFGYVRGAFTGANADRRGLWESAAGGTLFLDEIGETSPAMQVKLLRALQEREIRRVGATQTIKVNARVVAATNRDLEKEIKNGTFREDLFYRLNVIVLKIPALRERRGDIPLLAGTFLNRASEKIGRRLKFSDEALKIILNHDWQGNVRELEAAVQFGSYNAISSIINPEDLPEKLQTVDFKETQNNNSPITNLYAEFPTLDELERRYILYLLNALGGNRSKVAELLRINRRTLYRMMDRHNIKSDDE